MTSARRRQHVINEHKIRHATKVLVVTYLCVLAFVIVLPMVL